MSKPKKEESIFDIPIVGAGIDDEEPDSAKQKQEESEQDSEGGLFDDNETHEQKAKEHQRQQENLKRIGWGLAKVGVVTLIGLGKILSKAGTAASEAGQRSSTELEKRRPPKKNLKKDLKKMGFNFDFNRENREPRNKQNNYSTPNKQTNQNVEYGWQCLNCSKWLRFAKRSDADASTVCTFCGVSRIPAQSSSTPTQSSVSFSSMIEGRKILGLAPDASIEQVHQKYIQLAKVYHPDVNPSGAEQFKKYNIAYQMAIGKIA